MGTKHASKNLIERTIKKLKLEEYATSKHCGKPGETTNSAEEVMCVKCQMILQIGIMFNPGLNPHITIKKLKNGKIKIIKQNKGLK